MNHNLEAFHKWWSSLPKVCQEHFNQSDSMSAFCAGRVSGKYYKKEEAEIKAANRAIYKELNNEQHN